MDSRSNAHFLSSRALAQDKARRSIHTKHTLESTFQRDLALGNHSGDFLSLQADKPLSLSSRASETSVAIHKSAQVDSRKGANVSKQAKDSRIFDEKCGLQGQSQESYLSGNDCSDCPPLSHLSQKAKSTSQRSNAKPN
ncbi:hypothetical protein [Helicobacter zhangjianzhongii]|uniref:Uncharacterized protein n=1 Tax=Helicobacter zhangjianzhongii TaxID=2974574 RepID=A0ACC6FQQ8_9HELI|nr:MULTISPECIES: hypothetical protein [unclassified Helicobacter]MDL0079065.1 hypothetical protein [Helicobacter sp. CPD2-1]MDL0081091.1 hypothetical protein [Helicobacter sp. XJK30-2]